MDEPEAMDDFYEEEEIFLEHAVHCPDCDDLTGHEILTEKKKGTGMDYLLKCIDCSKVHTVHLRPPPLVEIPFILTAAPSSSTSKLELDADSGSVEMICSVTGINPEDVSLDLANDDLLPFKQIGVEEE